MLKTSLNIFVVMVSGFLFSCSGSRNQPGDNTGPGRNAFVAPVLTDTIWQFIDTSGNSIIDPRICMQGNDIPYFIKGSAVVLSQENQKFGVIDITGNWVIPPDYMAINGVTNNLFQCRVNNAEGKQNIFFNNMGQRIQTDVQEIDAFSEGLAVVRIGQKYGYMDSTLKLIIPAVFYDASPFSEGLAAVDTSTKRDEKGDRLSQCGFINKRGDWVIPQKWDAGFGFENGHCVVSQNGRHGIIDKDGELTAPFKFIFNNAHIYDNDLIFACDYDAYQTGTNKTGIINTKGDWIVTPQYEDEKGFAESAAAVKINGKWGFIDGNCKLVIPAKYEDAGSFKDGLAVVKYAGKYGMINKFGDWIIRNNYEDLKYFAYGIAAAKTGGEYGYINKKEEWIIKPVYKNAGTFHFIDAENSDL